MAGKLLSTNSVANMFDVTPYTVREWIKEGKLKAIKGANQQWRVTEEEAARFANEKYGSVNGER